MNELYNYIKTTYGNIFSIKENEPISKYTSLHLGGDADLFISISNIFSEPFFDDLASIAEDTIESFLKLIPSPFAQLLVDLKRLNIPYYIIGAGSDVLFSDKPFEGVVIKMSARGTRNLEGNNFTFRGLIQENISRHEKADRDNKVLDFGTLYFEEDHTNPEYIYAEAGCMISFLIHATLQQNLSGLQWFSHIPASVGGGVYNNIHGGKIMLNQYIQGVILFDPVNNIFLYRREKDMAFGYDDSRIQHSQEIVIGVIFRLFKQTDAEIAKAKQFNEAWIQDKIAIQPQGNTAGSTFKNITNQQKEALGLDTTSAGNLIDKVGLKGHMIGGAQIYTKHGNFFINTGNATAKDYRALIEYAIEKVYETYHIKLEPEIKMVNFSDDVVLLQ